MSIDFQLLSKIQQTVLLDALFVVLVISFYKGPLWVIRHLPMTRQKWDRWNERTAEKSFQEMSRSLHTLGLDDAPSDSLRAAGKASAGEIRLRYRILTFIIGAVAGDMVMAVVKTIETGQLAPDLRPRNLLTAVIITPILIWAADHNPAVSRYRFLIATRAAIQLCEAVYSSAGDDRPSALRALDQACANVRRSVLRIHRVHGSLGRFSPRRHSVKRNAALVAAKLQQMEDQVDTRGAESMKDLARVLVTIANNYAESKIGQLLPEADLEGVVAPEGRAPGLRLAAVVLATAIVACSWILLGYPGEGMPIAAGAAAALSSIAAYGPRAAMARVAELRNILGF
ncbi:hypothetical protein [Kitasatospora sp. NPDC001547]|uniref:hypothetical protein n=1 Tax=Kitasatospora sp. NPDC001547 TaxID=3364015 RepID=UPI003678238D